MNVGENMSPRISLRRGFTTEFLNRGWAQQWLRLTNYIERGREGEG